MIQRLLVDPATDMLADRILVSEGLARPRERLLAPLHLHALRARLDAMFGGFVDSTTHGAPTAVGGHSAWTVVEARDSGSATIYTCVSYVIADRHLYRLSVSANGNRSRPAEFDSLVAAMSGVHFQSAPNSGLPASQTAQRARQRYVLNALRAGGNDRQDQLRRMPAADIDAVFDIAQRASDLTVAPGNARNRMASGTAVTPDDIRCAHEITARHGHGDAVGLMLRFPCHSYSCHRCNE